MSIRQTSAEPLPSRAAKDFALYSSHMGAPVRRRFIKRSDAGRATPLQVLMSAARGGSGGGRGGRTRLALLLSLWWVNSTHPYTSNRPASWWAELIGIADPHRGTRVVSANMQELARRGFITIDAGDPGMANTVTLLDDMGSGDAYVRPDGSTGAFFRVPEQLWTTGMIGTLTGPALVMYLMMLYYYRRPTETGPAENQQRLASAPPVWFAGKGFRDSHGLSEDTRLAGIQALHEAGVIDIDSVSIDSSGASGHRRFRRQLLTLTPRFEPPLPGAVPKAGAIPDTSELSVVLPTKGTEFTRLIHRFREDT
jgi:hypothetical protein